MDKAPAQAFAEPFDAVKLYEVAPLLSSTGTWLQRILAPVIRACWFENPPPIELRPTGKWGGWAESDTTLNPDRRVSISNRARLWSVRGITHTVLHEWAHALTPGHGHDPVFYALNLALLMRLDKEVPPEDPGLAHKHSMSAYDLQDTPHQLHDLPDRGLGQSITWAWAQAQGLAEAQLSAEALALELERRFESWKRALDAAPNDRAMARQKRSRVQRELQELREQVAAYAHAKRALTWMLGAAGVTAILLSMFALSVVLRMQCQ